MGSKRISYEEVELFISMNDCILLTSKEEYKNISEKLHILCSCKINEFYVSFEKFKTRNKRTCNQCSKNRIKKNGRKRDSSTYFRLNFEEVKATIELMEGYVLLSTEYKNNSEKLEIQCSNNHIYLCTLSNFKQGRRCPTCRNTKLNNKFKKSFEEIKSNIESVEGYRLLSNDYINSFEKLEIQCPMSHVFLMNHASFINLGQRCPDCHNTTGENHPNWKGGISSLQECLRRKLIQWKKDSMKDCDYRCVITGDKFDNIHHLYSFHLILDESLKELNLDVRSNISEYTDEELLSIENKIIELHNNHPLGVCLRKDVHTLFHNIYGTHNNTPEQFYEFKNNYINGRLKLDVT